MPVVTPREVIDSYLKYGAEDFLELDLNQKSIGGSTKAKPTTYDTTYIPILLKDANDPKIKNKLVLKFKEIITASKAKLPKKVSPKDAKDMAIKFTVFPEEKIRGGDFVPKKSSNKKKNEENIRKMNEKVAKIKASTDECVQAMVYIDEGFRKLWDSLTKADPETLPFHIVKDPSKENLAMVTVNSLVQTQSIDEKTRKKTIFDHPMIKFKLPLEPTTKNLMGSFYKEKEGGQKGEKERIFKENVFDLREMEKAKAKNKKDSKKNKNRAETKVKNIPMKYRNENGKLEPLNLSNADKCITYKSIVSGTVDLSSLGLYRAGVSILSAQIQTLFVKNHQSHSEEGPFDSDEVDDIMSDVSDCSDSDNGDSDAENSGLETKDDESDKESDKDSADETDEESKKPEVIVSENTDDVEITKVKRKTASSKSGKSVAKKETSKKDNPKKKKELVVSESDEGEASTIESGNDD